MKRYVLFAKQDELENVTFMMCANGRWVDADFGDYTPKLFRKRIDAEAEIADGFAKFDRWEVIEVKLDFSKRTF